MRWIDGKKVTRYDRCPCVSGKLVRDCCELFLKSRPLPRDGVVGVMLSSKDLWPREFDYREILDRDLATISRQQLVHHLAKLNNLLYSDQHTPRRAKVPDLLTQILPDTWARKALLWLQTGRRHLALDRKLILSLLVYVLGSPRTEANSKLDEYPIHKLGEVIFRYASVLLDSQAERADVESDDDDLVKFRRVLADYMAQAFIDGHDDLGSVMTRSRKIYLEGFNAANKDNPNQQFDFRGQLLAKTGFPAEELNGVLVALREHYGKPADALFGDPREFQVGSSHFRRLSNSEARSRAPKLLETFSKTLEEFQTECEAVRRRSDQTLWHALPIYDHPLLKLGEDCFVPLDLHYLVGNLTEGLYWQMFREVGGPSSKDGKTLNRVMGRAVEWYCSELLTQAARVDPSLAVLADSRREIPKLDKVPTPDLLLCSDGVVLVIEVFTAAMSPTQILKADPALIAEKTKAIWLGSGPDDRGEANQIFEWVEACRSGRIDCPAVRNARKIVPVMLSLRTLPQGPGLTPWFREILKNGGAPDWFVRSCCFLDLYEIELLLALHAAGRSIPTALDQWQASGDRESTFRKFGMKVHANGPRHPVFARWFGETFDDVQRAMFPNGDSAA